MSECKCVFCTYMYRYETVQAEGTLSEGEREEGAQHWVPVGGCVPGVQHELRPNQDGQIDNQGLLGL